jgi:predicted ATPase
VAAAVVEAAMPQFPFGGAFVDLVPVPDGFVAQAVAVGLGVTEAPRQPLEEDITDRLSRGRALLKLDNAEHLLDAVAGFVERVLPACPDTRILITTRERLRMPEERIVPIGPLPPPDALSLFWERAAVAELCDRLDGLPLAIELAVRAQRLAGAPPALLTALGDYMRLLSGSRGADVRHRSMSGGGQVAPAGCSCGLGLPPIRGHIPDPPLSEQRVLWDRRFRRVRCRRPGCVAWPVVVGRVGG